MMHLVTEGMNCQWPKADGAVPQLTLLLDSEGLVTRANSALPHGGAMDAARRLNLHNALHQDCTDPDCHLHKFWASSNSALLSHGSAAASFWDPLLQRHLEIRSFLPSPGTVDAAANCFAVVMVDDVTEFRRAEARTLAGQPSPEQGLAGEVQSLTPFEKNNARLYAMLDMAPIFAALSDGTGALTYVNPYGRALLGLGALDDLSERSLLKCLAPNARVEFSEQSMPCVSRVGAWSGDSVLMGPDRCAIAVHLNLISLRDASGNLEGYTLLGRDIRESLRLETALRVNQEKMLRLAAQHLTIQESERRRIATDLHDGLGQTLSLIKLSIDEAVRFANSEDAVKVASNIEKLGLAVKSALSELRRTAMNLRPSTLDHLGIKATLAWHFREFEAASTGICLEPDIGVEEADVPDPLKITIYRIVQEAMGNALKHANADSIWVSLRNVNGVLDLCIEDDGQGFEIAKVQENCDFTHGIGLQSMLERAQLSGGDYELTTALGEGTKVHVQWARQPVSTQRSMGITMSA